MMLGGFLSLMRGRGHRQVYIASKALTYSGFVLGFIGIYSGILRLACYYAQCLLIPIEIHIDLLLDVALPLIIMGVGSLLSPAYYAYPPHGLLMIMLLLFGVIHAAVSMITVLGGWNVYSSHITLLAVSLIFFISNMDLLFRDKVRGFFRLMNISFTLSSLLILLYSLLITGDLAVHRPPWLPLIAFVTPMIFSVMMRTDPYTRRWFRENLAWVIFLSSMLAIASGFISIFGVLIDSEFLLDLALAILAASMMIAGILTIPRKSGSKILREYEVSIKLSIPWGLLGIFSGLAKIPGYVDLLTHFLALGFAGNIFIAYSRFLLPYRPFTPGLMKALTLPVIAIVNTGILLRILHSLSLHLYIEGIGGSIPIIASLSSSILLGAILAFIAIKIFLSR